MERHAEKILEKMKSPNYADLNFDFAFKLTNESERGALLVGTGKIEEYLEKLIITILPKEKKGYKEKLLNYPGPLSSFSGKIEILYAFRIIDKRVYLSLNTLRKLRNNAAHSSNTFSLQEIKKSLEDFYDFEEMFRQVVHKLALNQLISWKKEQIKTGLIEKQLDADFDYEKLWNERFPNPEENEIFQEQLTIWKLAFGLTFLCLKLEVITEEYLSEIEIDGTWFDLRNKNKT